MSGRAVPFHCPYCGEEKLFPHEVPDGPSHGAWECRSCLRAFKVALLGQLRPPDGVVRTSSSKATSKGTGR